MEGTALPTPFGRESFADPDPQDPFGLYYAMYMQGAAVWPEDYSQYWSNWTGLPLILAANTICTGAPFGNPPEPASSVTLLLDTTTRYISEAAETAASSQASSVQVAPAAPHASVTVSAASSSRRASPSNDIPTETSGEDDLASKAPTTRAASTTMAHKSHGIVQQPNKDCTNVGCFVVSAINAGSADHGLSTSAGGSEQQSITTDGPDGDHSTLQGAPMAGQEESEDAQQTQKASPVMSEARPRASDVIATDSTNSEAMVSEDMGSRTSSEHLPGSQVLFSSPSPDTVSDGVEDTPQTSSFGQASAVSSLASQENRPGIPASEHHDKTTGLSTSEREGFSTATGASSQAFEYTAPLDRGSSALSQQTSVESLSRGRSSVSATISDSRPRVDQDQTRTVHDEELTAIVSSQPVSYTTGSGPTAINDEQSTAVSSDEQRSNSSTAISGNSSQLTETASSSIVENSGISTSSAFGPPSESTVPTTDAGSDESATQIDGARHGRTVTWLGPLFVVITVTCVL